MHINLDNAVSTKPQMRGLSLNDAAELKDAFEAIGPVFVTFYDQVL